MVASSTTVTKKRSVKIGKFHSTSRSASSWACGKRGSWTDTHIEALSKEAFVCAKVRLSSALRYPPSASHAKNSYTGPAKSIGNPTPSFEPSALWFPHPSNRNDTRWCDSKPEPLRRMEGVSCTYTKTSS
eukprot:gene300-biopygen309